MTIFSLGIWLPLNGAIFLEGNGQPDRVLIPMQQISEDFPLTIVLSVYSLGKCWQTKLYFINAKFMSYQLENYSKSRMAYFVFALKKVY